MKLFLPLVILLVVFFISQSKSSEPATITVDRNWLIPESTKIGDVVKSALVQPESNKTVSYSLELDPFSSIKENPFWIHPHTGYIFLNKSLEGHVIFEII